MVLYRVSVLSWAMGGKAGTCKKGLAAGLQAGPCDCFWFAYLIARYLYT